MRPGYGLAAWLVLAAGCGATQFQTAHPTPPGTVSGYAGVSFVGNALLAERGVTVYNFQPDFGVRIGATEGLDVGVSQIFVAGLLADVKYDFLPPEDAFALAIRGGLGAAADIGKDFGHAWLLHVPVELLASWRIGRFEPYVGIGYGFYWIFGRSASDDVAGAATVSRRGYGDGVLRATAGLQLMLTERVGLLFEYTFLPAVVDDPGDNYSFVDTHVGGVGVRF